MCDAENPAKPWRLANNLYGNGTPALSLLHLEIERFYNFIQSTATEFYLRAEAVRCIEDMLVSIWPGASVEVFGSFRTGLNLPLSDIDLVVENRRSYWYNPPLYELESELVARGVADPQTVNVVDTAAVPVVKFTERVSQIKFDISFNVGSGVKAAELIKDLIHEFPDLPKLVMVLKQFLAMHGLNDVYRSGGISSYGITLMCIGFLQHQSQNNLKYNNNNRLGILLLKFLEYYGRKFDFNKYAISVTGKGGCETKEQLRSTMGNYNWQSFLSIQDPITPSNDIGRSSYAALGVMKMFEAAFQKLSRLVDLDPTRITGPILDSIVEVPQQVINYRDWVHYNFRHLVSSGSSSGPPPSPPSPGKILKRRRSSQYNDSKPCTTSTSEGESTDGNANAPNMLEC
ncbi:GL24402 [Drosophila persimilis]|uniref:polynucleotide adenylyltransferase n=1 Tax=Drosophila persimilis TaxID=7234 RepID=B4G5N9_DROPE|nr:inactive non-canonical poly(A) RNA polymerase protein Trf4-2 [Drosophila persimilis]EDW24905.1 GL24402 [Drosophila persimilis]